ncbi:MAG: hypothetical protein JWQ52_128 [Phenylobacterium sp.]|nr:hypothetical protein [Phenylobacterium sp.]
MSVDFTAPNGAMTDETESTMFAPTPVWARAGKKGRARAAATRTTVRTDEPTAGTTTYEATSEIPRTRTTTARRSGVGPGVVVAGVIAVGALAAGGWYVSQPHGVAQMTPGATTTTTTTSETALNSGAGLNGPAATMGGSTTGESSLAANSAAPPATQTTTQTTVAPASTPAVTHRSSTTRVARARARPSAATSAEGAGVNTSATAPAASDTLPSAPMPYSGSAQTPQAAPAPMMVTPPAAATVNPAPASSASPTTPATPTPNMATPPVATPPSV